MGTYTIRQLAEEFGLTIRTLRFYEDRKLVHPQRIRQHRQSQRLYNERDRERVAEIIKLSRMGFTLAEIAENNFTAEKYRVRLQQIRDHIYELEQAALLVEGQLKLNKD